MVEAKADDAIRCERMYSGFKSHRSPHLRPGVNGHALLVVAKSGFNSQGQNYMPEPKTAIIVLGAESSGTRLVTRCLISAGFFGDGDHDQRLDQEVPNVRQIVWRRSLPHGTEWPDLDQMLQVLLANNYSVRVIGIIRMQPCTILSKLVNNHAESVVMACNEIREAVKRIGCFTTDNNLPTVWLTYEGLVNDYGAFQLAMLAWGIKLPEAPETITNENKKWYVTI